MPSSARRWSAGRGVRNTVGKWRRRYLANGLDGLLDEPRPGAPRRISDAQVEEVIVRTLETMPKDATRAATPSRRALAIGRLADLARIRSSRQGAPTSTSLPPAARASTIRARDASAFAVVALVDALDGGAGRETWKLSKDPLFIDKVRDVVGLYLAPPERAVVLCVDEKSQIQALDRTAPILPMLPGTPARATHDYKHAGTSSLYAALDLTSGKVIGALHQRHRAIEFKRFLQRIDREVPNALAVHLVLDNSSTHKTPQIQRWLAQHPRFVLHLTPTASSWRNLVERWFAELTSKKLRRGTHRSVPQLNADIRSWIDTWNDDPRPYIWTKTADQILDSIARYRTRINDSRH
jgi:transposase